MDHENSVFIVWHVVDIPNTDNRWNALDGIHFLAERLAHPPLGGKANVERGVEVVVTGNHVNGAAPSGWMERLVLQSSSYIRRAACIDAS